jgi:transposase InsO family protein
MKSRQAGSTQAVSAAKADISVRSGRRIEKGECPAIQEHNWRTRRDPFAAVWESELVPLLDKEPSLTGITLWDDLNEKYPEQYPERLLRTLQRRVKHWQATQGPEKEAMFRQSVPAGHQGLSDFTHPNTAITIAGEPFKHLLYQFRLAYSGWRSVHIIQGGESYSALAEGLQNALHKVGGAPQEHRTDSLSAAYVNAARKQRLTEDYQALCRHYRIRPTTNNLGVSHENGAIEAPHGSLKRRIDQAIKLRDSADFPSIRAYREFVERIAQTLNKRCKGRLAEEQQVLLPLPQHRYLDYTELSVKVTSSSTMVVKRALYTVPSRLVGVTALNCTEY